MPAIARGAAGSSASRNASGNSASDEALQKAGPSSPVATVGVDLNHDGRADVVVTGLDTDLDGIPDALQKENTAWSVTRRRSSSKLGVQKAELLEWLQEELEVQRSCRSLPFTIVFWIAFVATQLLHRKVQTAHAMQTFTAKQFENAVSQPIPTTTNSTAATTSTSAGIALEAVTDLTKVYQWIDQTAIRLAWSDERNSIKYLSNFDRVLGGIRLQQRRLKTADCPGSSEVRGVFRATCYSTKGERNKSALSESGDLWQGSEADEDGLYTYWVDIRQTEAEALNHTQFLVNKNWLGAATNLVTVHLVLFNSQLARTLDANFIFTLSRTGYLKSKIKMKVVPVYGYDGKVAVIFDVIFTALLLWLGGGEILKIRRVLKDSGCRGLKTYLATFAALNWACVIVGIGLSIYYGVQALVWGELASQLIKIPDPPAGVSYEPGSRSWEVRHKVLNDIYDQMSKRATFLARTEVIAFWYTLLIVVKFFEAFSANPRLAIITDTLLTAMADLVHFLIVFASVFLNFSFGAYILFGSSIEEWSSPGRAVISSFRAFMGDFNFSDMYKVHNVSATVWFMSFMFLIFLVMLNMVLAIILDIYAEVKHSRDRRKTVTEQIGTLVTGFVLKMQGGMSKAILNDKLLKTVSQKDSQEDSILTPQELTALGLKEAQATKILNHVARKVNRKQANSKKDVVASASSQGRLSRSRSGQIVQGASLSTPEAAPTPVIAAAPAAVPRANGVGEDPQSSLRSAASTADARAGTAPLAARETTPAPATAASTVAPATAEATLAPAAAAAASTTVALKLPDTPPPDLTKQGLTSFARELLQKLERLQASQRPASAPSCN